MTGFASAKIKGKLWQKSTDRTQTADNEPEMFSSFQLEE
jgi:hypothetical protein